MTEQQSTQVALEERPPWNPNPPATPGYWYVALDGRRFAAEPQAPRRWTVWELNENGKVTNVDQDYVATVHHLNQIREACQLRVDGRTQGEIAYELLRGAARRSAGQKHQRTR